MNDLGNDAASRCGTDSSSSKFIAAGHQHRRRMFEQRDRLVPRHCRVVHQEIVQPVAGLEMFHQDTYGNPGAREHECSAEVVGIPFDQLVDHPVVPGRCPRFAAVAWDRIALLNDEIRHCGAAWTVFGEKPRKANAVPITASQRAKPIVGRRRTQQWSRL